MADVPVLLSWSGGKDAAWTLHCLRQSGVHVAGLITTLTSGYERVSMQGIRRSVLHAQAAATGLPLIEVEIPTTCDNATYETAFASGLQEARLHWPEARDIAFGDLFLQDIRAHLIKGDAPDHHHDVGRDHLPSEGDKLNAQLRAERLLEPSRELGGDLAGPGGDEPAPLEQ